MDIGNMVKNSNNTKKVIFENYREIQLERKEKKKIGFGQETGSFSSSLFSLRNRNQNLSIMEMIEEDKVDNRLKILRLKVLSGELLTQEELDFLRKHSPELYRIAMLAKALVEAFIEKLKNCKSKEEVQDLMLTTNMAYDKRINEAKIEDNELKELILKSIKNGINIAFDEFVKTDEYNDLVETEEETKKEA